MNQRSVGFSAGLALAVVVSLPAFALVDRGQADPRVLEPAVAAGRAQTISPQSEATGAAVAARDFLARRGGRWEFFGDPRTGRASLVQGEGIPLIPGAGNSLAPGSVPGVPEARGELSLEQVVPLAAAFLDSEAALVRPPAGRLVLDPEASGIFDGGRLIYVNYQWWVGDVPVEGAAVFVRINSGNIIQFGAELVGPIQVDPNPRLAAADATKAILRYSGDGETALPKGEPRLVIEPEDNADGGLSYRLVWVVLYKNFGRIETWEGRVDAATGQVVGFRDVNAYGRVTGGIYPRTVSDAEIVVPFPFSRVDASGAVNGNAAGQYPYPGGVASSSLAGIFFTAQCVNCVSPVSPFTSVTQGTGALPFGTGGTDATGNGKSTRADRNAFFHLNQVRRLGKKWLPTLSYFNLNMFAYVNIEDVCNAYYDGNVNFFRSGGGCNNTGEISDVMQHEWGHGLDGYTRGGDGATGEATADITAMHMTRDARVGPYFGVNGSSVRDLESARRGLITRSNVATFCPGGSGPLGYEVHCEGEIYGQAQWDLSKALVAKHGPQTGWRTSERIFFTSLVNARSYLATGTLPVYSAYLAADDDDGNLANGTPNGAEIYNAFNAHGIAGTARTSSVGCARPLQPAVTVSSVCNRLTVSWDAVPGVSSYQVLRSELTENTAYFPMATVGAGQTSWTDTEVAPGSDYWYVVMAVASGCESLVENPVHARLAAQPILVATGSSVDDTPRGNRSGFADPGEEVDLRVNLANLGELASTPVDGTVTAVTPGVTILDGTDSWPGIAVGAAAANTGVLRFVTDPAQVTCGSRVRFRLSSIDGGGCAAEDSYFEVMIGDDQPGGAVCDPTPPCFAPPTFAGAGAQAPGASCGEVDLGWPSASSNCQNAQIHYNVYRSTDPGFTPGPSNRVASSLAGTALHDTQMIPGVTYYYVVRADDSRSGEDGNLNRLAAVASIAADTVAPVFAGLASVTPGTACGEVRLQWPTALESCGTPVAYDVYRSTDPQVAPDPANRIATTFTPSFTDAAATLGQTFTYLVRARDAAGNVDTNLVRASAVPAALDRLLYRETFDAGDGGWTLGTPNDATSGRFEWGDPVGTTVQPEDDHTPGAGGGCWVTGLAGGGDSANDVDGGYTTIVSPAIDLTGTVSPFVRYARWFTNDRGSAPAEDPFETYVSNNNGSSYTRIHTVSGGTPLEWVVVDRNVAISRTANMRFRFVAKDVLNSSLVEAAIDDVEIWDKGQGCFGCPVPAPAVGTIQVSRSGDDIVLDWSADPVTATRFIIYQLTGPGFGEAVKVGTTDQRSFVHQGAWLSGQDFFYRVAAVDSCGVESSLE